jgi:cell division protein YceG involved in septum cleavage
MFKRLLILFTVVIIASFLAGFYYWRQFSSIPTWYQNKQENATQIKEKKRKSNDINKILTEKIIERSQSSQILRSAKSIKANLDRDKLEIGGVFNPSEIPQEKLDETQKAIMNKAITTFPQLKNLDIYVGLVSQLKLKNGHLVQDENNQLKVGKLSFTVDELAKRFGFSADKLHQYIDSEVAKLDLQNIAIDNDTIPLEISQQ